MMKRLPKLQLSKKKKKKEKKKNKGEAQQLMELWMLAYWKDVLTATKELSWSLAACLWMFQLLKDVWRHPSNNGDMR